MFDFQKDSTGRLKLSASGRPLLADGSEFNVSALAGGAPHEIHGAAVRLLEELTAMHQAHPAGDGIPTVRVLKPRTWRDLDTEEKSAFVRVHGSEAARDAMDSGAEIPPAA